MAIVILNRQNHLPIFVFINIFHKLTSYFNNCKNVKTINSFHTKISHKYATVPFKYFYLSKKSKV